MVSPIYQGQKCRLRPLRPDDLEANLEWRNDPSIRDFSLGFRFPVGRVMEEKWLNEVLSDRSGNRIAFAIEAAESGALVGMTQFYNLDWISRTALFGVKVGDKRQQGKGIGSEASRLMLGLAFEYYNLHKVTLLVAAFNKSAIKIYRDLGFELEGTLKRHVFYDNRYHDLHYYSRFRPTE